MTIKLADRIAALTALGITYYGNMDGYALKDLFISEMEVASIDNAEFEDRINDFKNKIAGNPTNYQDAQLTIMDRSVDVFKEGADILRANKERAAKAIAIGKKILADLQSNNGIMTPELDARMMKFLSNCNTAKGEMNDLRKAITQTLDIINGEFTGAENMLDKAKKDTVAFEIQQIRNRYALQLQQEEEERQRKIKLDQDKKQEAINLKAECERRLVQYIGEFTRNEKQRINTAFNAITLETYEEKSQKLNAMLPALPYAHYQNFKHNLTGKFHTPDEIGRLIVPVFDGAFEQHAQTYKTEIIELQLFLIERLPSKYNELLAIKEKDEEDEKNRKEQLRLAEERKTANAANQKKIDDQIALNKQKQDQIDADRKKEEDARIAREQEDTQRIAREQEDKQKIQLQAVEDNKEVETTMSLFDTVIDSTTNAAAAPEARAGYEIVVLGPVGYMQVFQQWFNEVGKTMDVEKIGNTKPSSMKTFCEKLAFKDENKKIASNFLRYDKIAKAVNRKTTSIT